MHGLVGQASITIIVNICIQTSYCVVTLHNKLKYLGKDVCCFNLLLCYGGEVTVQFVAFKIIKKLCHYYYLGLCCVVLLI